MFADSWNVNRKYIGKNIQNYMELPNLVDIQTASYEKFLQCKKLAAGEELENIGLQSVFTSIFPIVSANEDMALEYEFYTLDMDRIKYSEYDCKKKGRTYAVPLRARINLTFYETGEIRQKDIYLGDIPLMTDRGTFIINGAERVVVSQLHRSPGVIFTEEKEGVFSSRLIPYRGNWLEFEIDRRHNVVMAKVDRKKGILATLFLRALGIDTREKIIRCFHGVQEVSVSDDRETKENLVGRVLASSVLVDDESGSDEKRKLFRAGEKLNPHTIDDILAHGVSKIDVIDFECKNSLNSNMIINCFEREDIRFPPDDEHDEPTPQEAVTMLYSILQAGNNMMTTESALQDLKTTFFSSRRYELGAVGRYKLNKKFNYENGEGEFNVPGTDIVYNRNPQENVLTIQDIISTIRFLINVNDGRESISDIDHLGNRRVRSVGELLTTQMKAAVSKIDRIAKERMTSKDRETLKPQDLVSIKPLASTLKEFFGSSQLSQFMDQVNPLSEMTHKRRLNALGPGGLSRDRAGFAVRDVHYTHYGRICPIETPEGPNIGLILSLAIYAKVNEYGFLESPFRKIEDGKATETVEY
ncbi:MAG: DNA-directed RNA polymerase subunit beta, partial [Spirochaetaceae bacterium]|nr:DNA-directed RNA polymerase subunit beta [Spirochaetaceae bacterium]